MGSAPPVTIGLPVYNGERYLSQAIESILAQEFGEFHLLISDNCSTDSTWEICCSYASRDPRIKLYRSPSNLGAIGNFNRVLHFSESPFFMWTSHDDVLHPSYTEACYRFLRANPDYVLCCTRNRIIDAQGIAVRPLYKIPDQNLDSDDSNERFQKFLVNKIQPTAIYGLMSRSVAVQIGGVKAVMGSDWIFLLRLSLEGKFREMEEPLRDYRRISANIDPEYSYRSSYETMFGSQGERHFFPWIQMCMHLLRDLKQTKMELSARRRLLRISLSHLMPQILYFELTFIVQRLTYRFPTIYRTFRSLHRRIAKSVSW